MFTKREFNYIWNKDIGYSSPWYKDLVGDVSARWRALLTRSLAP